MKLIKEEKVELERKKKLQEERFPPKTCLWINLKELRKSKKQEKEDKMGKKDKKYNKWQINRKLEMTVSEGDQRRISQNFSKVLKKDKQRIKNG